MPVPRSSAVFENMLIRIRINIGKVPYVALLGAWILYQSNARISSHWPCFTTEIGGGFVR